MSQVLHDLEEFGAIVPPEPDAAEQQKSFQLPDKIKKGERGDTIRKLLRSQKARGLSFEAAVATCEIENRNRCEPPLEPSALEYQRWWNQPDDPKFKASKGKIPGRSNVTKLINLVVKSGAELFTTPADKPHV